MARLSTHVLDISRGKPAAGMRIELYSLKEHERVHLKTVTTNKDGRTDEPLLTGEHIPVGMFELVFEAAPYFRKLGETLPDPPFIDGVVIRFGISDSSGHYHVPLLVSPYGYSTYRGS
ncbi:MAG TPA: hydroxyisourate hydrolase [Opitutaceae bacterium]|nr:hydroxyisourate hydrolase [Opitutaceae bacterium]